MNLDAKLIASMLVASNTSPNTEHSEYLDKKDHGLNDQQIDVEVVAVTGSTNADLLSRIAELTRPLLRIAENQTAGRGRVGRVWHSIPGGMLTFSLAWHFSKKPQQLMGLSLAVGVALAEALISLDVPVKLKWPNDLIKDNKKLGGILIETATVLGGTWAVIGVGINLQVPAELEQRIGQEVADAPWLAQMDRNALVAQLTLGLAAAMNNFESQGFEFFALRWNRLHAHANQEVSMIENGILQHQGIAIGVDANGCLQLQTPAGVVLIHTGDVSLRASQHFLHE